MRYIFIIFLGLVFAGCAFNGFDPNRDYSFNAAPNEIVQNPKPGESRLYFVRPTIIGALVSYDITLHTTNDITNNFKSGYFLGKSRARSAFYVDIIPNGAPIIISAKTETRESISFNPKPNAIYCVLTTLQSGFFVARPNFNLLDKQECIKHLEKFLTKESMERWRKDRENFYGKK